MTSTINPAGLALLVEFEDWRAYAYPDPASPLYRASPKRAWGRVPAETVLSTLPADVRVLSGAPWTIGYGFTQGVRTTDGPMTKPEGESRKLAEVAEFALGVHSLLKRPANENEFAAMVVLAYNIGLAAFARSTVLRAHNAGDTDAAARAFGLWNKAGGQIMRGLIRRRAAESALYLKPVRLDIPVPRIDRGRLDVELDAEYTAPTMPQRIDAERPMSQSSIVRGAGISGGVAGITLAAEGARAVGDIRYSLGDWLPYAALAVVVVAAAWIIRERLRQRRGGWA